MVFAEAGGAGEDARQESRVGRGQGLRNASHCHAH